MTTERHVLMVAEPGIDGVFRHVERVAAHLVGRGWVVDFAYSSRRSGPALRALVRRLESSRGVTLDLRVGNAPGVRDVSALLQLRRLVRLRQPSLVHAHSSKAGALTRLLPLPGRPTVFYTPHAYFGLRPGAHWQGRFYNRLEKRLGRRGMTLNVSASEAGFAATVLGIPSHRRRTISNGIDLENFRPATPEERAVARARFGLQSSLLVLACLARLSPQKDPHTLYRGVAAARAAGVPVHLVHVGTGPKPSYAQELLTPDLRSHVTRVDALADPRPLYHAADGLIVTSRYEGLSYVALEALGCGLPLVLSRVGGNDDLLLKRLSHVHTFEAGDVAGAAAVISQWAAYATRPVVTNHRSMACLHFDERDCHARIEQAFDAALGVVAPQAAFPAPLVEHSLS